MKTLNILLEITVYAGILFCAIMLFKLSFKGKMSPFLHFAVWGLLIARLLVPITMESPVHLLLIPDATDNGAVQQHITNTDNTFGANALNMAEAPPPPNASRQTQNAATISTVAESTAVTRPTSLSTEEILLGIWLTGVGIGLLYLAILYGALRKRIQRNAHPPSTRLLELLAEVKAELNIKRDVRIIGQCEYGTPAVLFPNTVLMPINMLVSMRDDEVKFVLRHELMHFKRGDHLTGLLLSVLNAVYWFNPIVWIAFKQIRADMETACDSDVVRYFSCAEKSAYAALILSLFSKKQYGNLALCMVQGNTKTTAKKRIRGVFMHNKTNKKVKTVAVILSGILLFTCFTTACQPTPENEIVQNKSGDELMDAINADDTEASGSTPASGDDSSVAQYEAIDHVSFELEIAANGTKLNADADVTVPDSVNMPVVSYKRKDFTEGFVDGIFDALLGESPFYERSEARSKSEIQDLIVEINYEYHDLDSPMAIEKGITDIEELHSLRDEALQHLYKELETAPDEVPLVEIAKELFDEGYVCGQTPLNDDQMMELRMTNTEYAKEIEMIDGIGITYSLIGKDGYNTISYKLQQIMYNGEIVSSMSTTDGPFIYPADTQPETMTTTPAQAVEIAEKAFHDMGAGDDVQVSDIYYVEIPRSDNFDEIYCYGVVLKRYIGGMPIEIESSSNEGMEQTDNSDQFNAGVPSEMMMAFISDEGIIHLRWSAPIEVVEVLNQNVELAATDEVIEVFKQEFKNAYSDYTDEDVFFSLYDIKLNYGIARIQDENELYMAIPLWEFYASRPVAFYDEDGNPREELQYYDLITINAIDKSRFSREWGY